MERSEKQFQRIDAILGDSRDQDMGTAVKVFFEHLRGSLVLPCDVTGAEDFQWEERYVIGGASPREYERLRKDQPSYQDTFELLKIELGVVSEWMMFPGEDIAAEVRRKSDKKTFILGLAELKAVDRKSPNYQLIEDFGVFLVNNR
ncbi:MAG TPA: hypothetical protein VKA46_31660 [Gemmataceae bacterium]|nr:hypothetical protein [Gemmataceae bacterium]